MGELSFCVRDSLFDKICGQKWGQLFNCVRESQILTKLENKSGGTILLCYRVNCWQNLRTKVGQTVRCSSIHNLRYLPGWQIIKFCFRSSSKFLGPIDFSYFSQKKILIINVKFYWPQFIVIQKNFYHLTLCQMLRNLPLLVWTQGQILKAHVGFATRSTVSGPLWKSLWIS